MITIKTWRGDSVGDCVGKYTRKENGSYDSYLCRKRMSDCIRIWANDYINCWCPFVGCLLSCLRTLSFVDTVYHWICSIADNYHAPIHALCYMVTTSIFCFCLAIAGIGLLSYIRLLSIMMVSAFLIFLFVLVAASNKPLTKLICARNGRRIVCSHFGGFTVPDEIFRCLFNASDSRSSGGIWIACRGKSDRSHYTSGNIMMTKIHTMFSRYAALMAGLAIVLTTFSINSTCLFMTY